VRRVPKVEYFAKMPRAWLDPKPPKATLVGLWQEHRARIASYFAEKTLDADLAAALTLETAAELERRFDSGNGYPSGDWLHRVAQIVLTRYYRSGQVSTARVAPPPINHFSEVQQESLEVNLDLKRLRNAARPQMEMLPTEHRVPLELRVADAMSYEQIALQLDISTRAARGSVARGLRALASLSQLTDGGEHIRTILGPDGQPLATATERAPILSAVAEINHELVQLLIERPELMYQLPPRRFEELVAEIYLRRGFEALLTPASGDGGVDVYVVRNDEFGTALTIVQCKRYSPTNKVGVATVRELYGVVQDTEASKGALVTTSFFTAGALGLANRYRYRLSLHDYFSLQDLLQLGPRDHH
jgi:DNA-directed RNA polymerase specialized sigma24 family protein